MCVLYMYCAYYVVLASRDRDRSNDDKISFTDRFKSSYRTRFIRRPAGHRQCNRSISFERRLYLSSDLIGPLSHGPFLRRKRVKMDLKSVFNVTSVQTAGFS